MKRLKLITLTIFFILVPITVIIYSQKIGGSKMNEEFVYTSTEYNGLWKKVDSLAAKGLTRSVLAVVDEIYEKAKKTNNAPQFIKVIIHKLKFESYIEDEADVLAIDKLNRELASAQYPLKPVIHSLIANLYWRYYRNHQWEFSKRTTTVSFPSKDLKTWSLKQLFHKIIHHYNQSLINARKLKKIPLNIYDEILTGDKKTMRVFRPTIYDFLAHRAVDFFMTEEVDLIRPADIFQIEQEHYFAPAKSFVTLKISSSDTFSLQLHALQILQDLIAFHSPNSDPSALIDVDLKRLHFVHRKAILHNKDELFLKALRKMAKEYANHPAAAEIKFYIAREYYKKGLQYQPLVSDTNKWMLKKAHDLCTEVIKQTDEGNFGHGCCRHLRTKIEQKVLSFEIGNGTIPHQPFTSLLTYKNLKSVYVRIIKCDPQWFYTHNRKYDRAKLIEAIRKLPESKEWQVQLKNDGDFQQHTTEITYPGLDQGFYLILIGTHKNFAYTQEAVAYSWCWVSNLSYISRKNHKSAMEYHILNRASGEPINNVTVQMFHEKYNRKNRAYEYHPGEKAKADKNGYILLPHAQKGNYYYLEFTSGEDLLHTERSYNSRYYKSRKQKHTRTIFFTDRAIYRPGQTIYFKGLMLEKDDDKTRILPDQNTKVTFYDVNHEKIADFNLVSNQYGSFNGTFTAPRGVLNGRMTISNKFGTHSFLVEEYKRPQFEVILNPPQGEYRLQDTVTVTGMTKSYAGANVNNASLKFRVVRRAVYPPWWRWYSWTAINTAEMEIANGFGKTTEQGEFSLQFKAIPDPTIERRTDPKFHYTITVEVTDITGETHTAEHTVVVGYSALNLALMIPEKLNKASSEKFLIHTTNLAGKYQYAKGTITIYKLKTPQQLFRPRLWQRPDKPILTKDDYNKKFPYDPYADEHEIKNWPKGKAVLKSTFNTEQDSLFQIKKLKRWKPGQYMVEAQAQDAYGETVKDIKYITVYSVTEKKVLPVHAFDWFSVLADQGEPGEVISLVVGSKSKGAYALYEIESQGKIVHKEWLSLNNEQKLIKIPITEAYRGNFVVHLTMVKENREYQHQTLIKVPYTNKQLDLTFATFRNKLVPGQKEEWKLTIKDPKGAKVTAEMLASMYDASLDAFAVDHWILDLYTKYYVQRPWDRGHTFRSQGAYQLSRKWNSSYPLPVRQYERLNFYGYHNINIRSANMFGYGGAGVRLQVGAGVQLAPRASADSDGPMEKSEHEPPESAVGSRHGKADFGEGVNGDQKKKKDMSAIKARADFNETAFFFPHLETNEEGDIILSFTMPEALTRWKFRGLAHSRDLQIGTLEEEIITQKDLMIMPYAPRFFREHDKLTFTAKVSNLADKKLQGKAQLMLFDALTMKPVDQSLGNRYKVKSFSAEKGQSIAVSWDLTIPEGLQAVTYKVVAQAGDFTDGEERALPILTNRMLVTEPLPLPIRGKQKKKYTLKKLVNANQSPTLKNHKLTLEYTSNPAWYAVQALPYIMEYPYECSEQLFSRFYANSLASMIANAHPRIKRVFDAWRGGSGDAFLSNLEKNQELKSLLLEETPWVIQAKDESTRKKNVALLFDLNRMAQEQQTAMLKLAKMQSPSGGWPWFSGMPENRYITQHIVAGMGHLKNLGISVLTETRTKNMIERAIRYLDQQIQKDYDWLKKHHPDKMDKNHLSGTVIQYLYARSYFLNDFRIAKKNREAFEYYQEQAAKYWLKNNRYLQGMIALALHRLDVSQKARDIIKSLKENAMYSEELGMYWNDIAAGYYWFQAPIETIALLIEAFSEISNDQKSVESMKVWLLKNKQTNDWKTTKATSDACYALLLKGTDWLAQEPNISISLGSIEVDPKKIPGIQIEAGTGYFKTSWFGSEIKPEMGTVTVTKGNDGVAWGALYWQYFEQLDKITTHETPLKLKKKLFIEKASASGPIITPVSSKDKLRVGDKLIVRIELQVDRDMEYIHMKDMRAAGLEPINVVSSYKYQDGLGYYESTKDASTNFFISFLPKGTYVFEYPLRVSHKGDFSNGITSIQCMYAPEFASHSEGTRIQVLDQK